MGVDPVKSVFQNGSPVDKAGLIGIDTGGLRWRVANADAIRNTDFSSYNCLYVGSTQIPYDLDPADTTTSDDDTDSSDCIIDLVGNRFKNSQVGLLASLATLLSNTDAVLAASVATVAAESSLPNSRKITVAAPLTLTDGGAGANLLLGFTGPMPVSSGGTGMTTFSVPSNKRNAFSASHNIANSDKNSCVTFTNPGGGYTCTFLAPSNYDSDFSCIVNNESQSRAVTLALNSYADGTNLTMRLYPLQSYFVFSQNGLWFLLGGPRRWTGPDSASFYVDPSGNDNNDGLASGSSNAMATVLACWKRIGVETETRQASIQLTAGVTYPACGELDGDWFGQYGRLIAIVGDPTMANPAQIICGSNDNCAVLRDGAWATFSGIEFGSSGTNSNGVNIQQTSLADFGKCKWGDMTGGSNIFATDASHVNITANQTVAGNATAHWNIQHSSKLIAGSVEIDGTNTINYASAFAIGSEFARIISSATFTGFSGVTAPQYILQRHSILEPANALPGSTTTPDATSNVY